MAKKPQHAMTISVKIPWSMMYELAAYTRSEIILKARAYNKSAGDADLHIPAEELAQKAEFHALVRAVLDEAFYDAIDCPSEFIPAIRAHLCTHLSPEIEQVVAAANIRVPPKPKALKIAPSDLARAKKLLQDNGIAIS